MMLEHLGWTEAASATESAIEKTILQKKVTYDLARLLGDVAPLRTSEFGTAIIENLPG
jgi:isocitrate dehydrogenase